MRKILLLAFLLSNTGIWCQAQDEPTPSSPNWTEADQQYLLDNLIRTKDALLLETAELSEAQWRFKEAPDRWSINQILEHLAIWELILMHEVSVSLNMGPIDNFNPNIPDSTFLNQDPEANPNKTENFTKPFTFTVPLGYNDGINNFKWWFGMRTESIDFLREEQRNLRQHYINFGQNIHQQYMVIFSHTDRHLKQILNVKNHPDYPQ